MKDHENAKARNVSDDYYAKRIKLRESGKCPTCGGSGAVEGGDPYEPNNKIVCDDCGGTGKYPKPRKYTLDAVLYELEEMLSSSKVSNERIKSLIENIKEGKKVWPLMRDEV